MIKKRWQYVALCLFAYVGLIGKADAAYSNVFFFGDSLSDNGNLLAATSGTAPPSPPYATGRFSNGLVWSEYFAGYLGHSTDPVLVTPSGNNYAVAGAAVVTRPSTPPLTPIPTQMQAYLASAGGVADPSALYVIMGGANDVADLLGAFPNQADRLAGVDLIGSALSQMVSALAFSGARNILLANIPDFSLVPRFLGDADARELAERFAVNVAAIDAAASAAVDLDVLDLLGQTRSVIANGAALGFTDTTHACLLTLGCNPDVFFYYDDIHPTTRVHDLIARAALGAVPEPSTAALTLVAVAALLVGGVRRRSAA